MPITGLSNREAVDPRFVEIGRLRKGGPKKRNERGKEIQGDDLDHFRYVPNVRYQESAVVFEELYGPEPAELEIFFPFDEMERVFSSWREAYGQNRLCRLRCDGARWHDWIEGNRHFHSEAGRECDLPYRDTENKCPECPCQYSGRLQVILRPMWKAGQIGLITVMTSSINDIAHLASKLVQWEPLSNKPFRLWRAPERIGVPFKDKRAGVDKSLLHLELADHWMRKMFFEAQDQAAAALLEAPAEELPFDEPPYDDDESPTDDERDLIEHKADEAEAKRELGSIEAVDLDILVNAPPLENDWREFYERCVNQLLYNSPSHASKVKDEVWTKGGDLPWADMWAHMVRHQVEAGRLVVAQAE